jgi:hypothetical protein
MSSEQIWYEANAYAGKMSVQAGCIFIAAAIVLYFLLRPNFVAYNITCTIVLLSSLAVDLFLSFRYLRSL